MDNIISMKNILERPTPKEIIRQTAQRLRELRRRRKISQADFAGLSGVSLGSLKRFETTGEISFLSLAKIAFALHSEDEFDALFEGKEYLSIEEVIREHEKSVSR